MKYLLRMTVAIVACVCGVSAQSEPPQRPSFEVASIKPSAPTGMAGVLTYPGGRVRFGHLTLKVLMQAALDVQLFQVTGGPGWASGDMFDIDARVPASSASSALKQTNPGTPMNEEQRGMLLSLLAQRFQLKYHLETKPGSVFILVRGKNALKLEDPKNKEAVGALTSPNRGLVNGDGIAGQNLSMSRLARWLSYYLGRIVVDRTGIDGAFDFRYDYVTGDSHPDVEATIITSIRAIGLELEATRGPVETAVIDSVEKPTPD